MLRTLKTRIIIGCAMAVAVIFLASAAWVLAFPQSSSNEASLLDGFRHVEVASVSDALEQITGKRMYMSHRMQPIFTTRFAGYAVTVRLKKMKETAMPGRWMECSRPSITGKRIRFT